MKIIYPKAFSPFSVLCAALLSLATFSTPLRAENVLDREKKEPISQQEFLKKMERRFEKKDKNGDGVISREEFMESAQRRFSRMDRDQDGQISSSDHWKKN